MRGGGYCSLIVNPLPSDTYKEREKEAYREKHRLTMKLSADSPSITFGLRLVMPLD